MVRSFGSVQGHGLRLSSDKILLKIDVSHFKPAGYAVNAPHLLGIAATHVTRVRGQSIEEILQITHQNAEGLSLGNLEASGILDRLIQEWRDQGRSGMWELLCPMSE